MFEGITFKTVKSLPIKDIDYSNFFVQYKNVQIAKTKYYDELQNRRQKNSNTRANKDC